MRGGWPCWHTPTFPEKRRTSSGGRPVPRRARTALAVREREDVEPGKRGARVLGLIARGDQAVA
ncbi:MAG TPA: hypothetical protein VE197_11880, partial [Mycobacterium sp.]|nr:hypothetical protein [Mycobacterium sp.]